MPKQTANTSVLGDDDQLEKPGSPEAPIPHPLTPEANAPAKPGEVSDPENQEVVDEEDQE